MLAKDIKCGGRKIAARGAPKNRSPISTGYCVRQARLPFPHANGFHGSAELRGNTPKPHFERAEVQESGVGSTVHSYRPAPRMPLGVSRLLKTAALLYKFVASDHSAERCG